MERVRTSIPAAAGALGIALAACPPAAAQDDGLRWMGEARDDIAYLAYAVPHTDHGVIDFTCARGSGRVLVSYFFEPVGAADGMGLDVELFSEGGRVLLAMTGQRWDLDDSFILSGETELTPELAAMLEGGATLSVTVQDSVEDYPLADAREPALDMLTACAPAPRS